MERLLELSCAPAIGALRLPRALQIHSSWLQMATLWAFGISGWSNILGGQAREPGVKCGCEETTRSPLSPRTRPTSIQATPMTVARAALLLGQLPWWLLIENQRNKQIAPA